MNILFVSHLVPYPPHGGSLQRNFNLVREIAKHHDLYLVCLNQKALNIEAEQLEDARQILGQFCKHLSIFDIPCERSRWRWYTTLFCNLFSSRPYSVARFSSRELRTEIKHLSRKVEFDVVHIDTVSTAHYAKLVSSKGKVLNHHNVESTLMLRRASSDKSFLRKLYLSLQGVKLRKLERREAPRFDVNLVVSEPDARELMRIAPDSATHVVANGTDTDFFLPAKETPAQELVYAGGMTWYPNQDAMEYFLADIFPLIQKMKPEIKMNVVGAKPSRKVLELARSNENVIIHGFVQDVRPIIARSAVYVVPLRVGGGTRLKILDASAAGKAIVSTGIGCEGIRVRHGKDIWIADDPTGFADAVTCLLDEPNLRRKLEQGARSLAVEEYSWPAIAKDLELAYQMALGQKRGKAD